MKKKYHLHLTNMYMSVPPPYYGRVMLTWVQLPPLTSPTFYPFLFSICWNLVWKGWSWFILDLWIMFEKAYLFPIGIGHFKIYTRLGPFDLPTSGVRSMFVNAYIGTISKPSGIRFCSLWKSLRGSFLFFIFFLSLSENPFQASSLLQVFLSVACLK